LHSIVRPYPAKVAGVLLSFSYELHTGEFSVIWAFKQPRQPKVTSQLSSSLVEQPPLTDVKSLSCRETEIFVPDLITRGRRLILQGIAGNLWRFDESRQTLFVLNPEEDPLNDGMECIHIQVQLDPPLSPRWSVKKKSATRYYLTALIVVLIAILCLQFWRTL
jgi:hypothetical protein